MRVLDDALYSTLSGGTALAALVSTRIYNGAAPQGAAFPYVTFSTTGADDNEVPRRSRTMDATVRAISSTSKREAQLVDEAVEALLQDAKPTVTGWDVWWCKRDTDVDLVDNVAGVDHFIVGAIYEIRLDKQP